MTDQDENRPLTRRELRLREMAAAGVSVEPEAQEPQASQAEELELQVPEFDIPLIDEGGRMLSRREIRELREQAVAAWIAENTPEGTAPADETRDAEVVADGSDAPESTDDAETADDDDTDDVDAPVVAIDEPADAVDEPADADEAEGQEGERAEKVAEDAETSGDPKAEYSFPDITPLDEGQSVFDDPTVRMMGVTPTAAGEADTETTEVSGDFDDLINRAVAQEGGTGVASTSALILPSMPEADSLAGPLGETGELYVTGSYELPKTLSETGGHSSLHDSGEFDESLDDLGLEDAERGDDIMSPVSASRAVSMRGGQGPLVSEATKDKSKVPAALIATGGVLVLGAAGLIIWAASSGLFG